MDREKHVTVKEAADLTGKHIETIRRWIRKGLIDSKRFPPKTGKIYIPETELPSFLRGK